MEETKDKSLRWRVALVLLVFVGAMGLSLYLVLCQVWPVSILIDWQTDLFDGEYYPVYTTAVVCIIMLVVPMILLGLLAKLISIFKTPEL